MSKEIARYSGIRGREARLRETKLILEKFGK
jgi:hypothetical protein